MSKENPLSHHEQLRYDYLLKNIHYLNEREKNEFVYLQEKLTLAREIVALAWNKKEKSRLTYQAMRTGVAHNPNHKHSLSLQKRKDGSSVLNEFLW